MKPVHPPPSRAASELITLLPARPRSTTYGLSPTTHPTSCPGCRTGPWYTNGVPSYRRFLQHPSATRAPRHEALARLAQGRIHKKALAATHDGASRGRDDRQSRAHNRRRTIPSPPQFHDRSSRPLRMAPRARSMTTTVNISTPSHRCRRPFRCG